MNADQVDSDGGDFESIGYNIAYEGGMPGRVTRHLAKLGITCNTPAKVECRHARSQRPWFAAEDDTVFPRRINCKVGDSFICRDSQQADGHCQDYEVARDWDWMRLEVGRGWGWMRLEVGRDWGWMRLKVGRGWGWMR